MKSHSEVLQTKCVGYKTGVTFYRITLSCMLWVVAHVVSCSLYSFDSAHQTVASYPITSWFLAPALFLLRFWAQPTCPAFSRLSLLPDPASSSVSCKLPVWNVTTLTLHCKYIFQLDWSCWIFPSSGSWPTSKLKVESHFPWLQVILKLSFADAESCGKIIFH